MTIYAWARPRTFPQLPAPVARFFDVARDARVLAHCFWQPSRREVPTLLAYNAVLIASEGVGARGRHALAHGLQAHRRHEQQDHQHLHAPIAQRNGRHHYLKSRRLKMSTAPPTSTPM